MEHLTQYYDFRNGSDKHFFAGLLNTALNNFNQTFQELSHRLKKKIGSVPDFINMAFADNISPNDWKTRLEYIGESLVFVKQFKDEDERANFRDTLKGLYQAINDLRNFYTHFYHEDIQIGPTVFKFLDESLLNAARSIKTRMKSDEYKEHLFQKYEAEFDEIFIETNKGKSYKKQVKLNDKLNYVINTSFYNLLYKNGEITELKNNAKSCYEDKKLTRNGFVLLLSLFLNKKQLEGLFAYTKYFKRADRLEYQITRNVFSYYAYRDIRKLFRSDYTNDSLLLQMMDDLSKCPDELFRHLPKEKKAEFFEDLNVYFKDNPEYSGKSYDSMVSHEVLRKRYEDKFAYFAIRHLDEIRDFPNLRFSVNLGKFNHHTEEKLFKGVGFSTERRILEKISVFEKLSVATNKKAAYFNGKEENRNDSEWLEFPMPYYQFTTNNIGIWINIDGHGQSDAAQHRENDKPSKYDVLRKLGLENSLKKTIAFLSINELPALLHALIVEKKTEIEIERIIRDKVHSQYNIIREFGTESQFDKKTTPIKLKKALGNKEAGINLVKLLRDIDNEIKKDPLVEIRKNYSSKEKKERKLFTNPEKGKIATWLSKDILRFVEKDVRKDTKGYQFAEFQVLLSFYDHRQEDVRNFIEQDLEIKMESIPIYLFSCLKKDSLYEFYKCYIDNRKKYLKIIKRRIDKNEVSEDFFTYFKKRRYILPTLENYKKQISQVPVNLPRGLFDDKPTFVMPGNNQEIADWFRLSSNIETAQEFYRYSRAYEFTNGRDLNTVHIKSDNGIKGQCNKYLKKSDIKSIYKNEKQIRKIMRQDYFILEMAKDILKQTHNFSGNLDTICLTDVFLNKNEKNRIQEEAIEGTVNDSHILSNRLNIEILGGRIKDDIAIKSVGKFKRLSQDQRVCILVSYFPDKVWNYTEIADELTNYEKVRSREIFKSIHDLESKINDKAEQNNEHFELLHNEKPNFKHYISYGFLESKEERQHFNAINFDNVPIIEDLEDKFRPLALLIIIRNKFAHNQLIPIDYFNYLRNSHEYDEKGKVSNFLNSSFIEIMESFKV